MSNPRRWLLPLLLAAAPASVPGASGEDAVLAPSENLVADGLPPIPASIQERAFPYAESRSAIVQGWDPKRREMLILTRFGDTAQVHLVRMPMGARRQITFFPDRVGGAAWQPVRGESFVFSKDSGGNEFYQLYRYDWETGQVTLLTDGKSRNLLGVWSRDGRRMAYVSTRRNGKDTDVYVIDPAEPKSDRLLAEVDGGGWEVLDWSPDGKHLLMTEEISAQESYLWLLDPGSGERKLVTPKGGKEKVSYQTAAYAAGGKALWITTDRDSEFHRLGRIDLASGEHTYFTSDIPWDVEKLAVSHDLKTVAFVTNEDGIGVLRLLDAATGKARPAPKLPVGIIGGLEWSADDRELAITLSTVRSPSDAFSIDVASGKLTRWTESEIGGLDPERFQEPVLVRWKSFDGKSISGFLYRPPARFDGRRPVIISIHGGPEGQARPGFKGRDNFYLNELGVALLVPNVRGSSGYGKSFLALDNGRLREDSVKDIGSLLDWVATNDDLDPERVMIMGGSYGGYMTLATAFRYSDRIRCAMDTVGISNFVSFLERTEAYRRDLRRVEYGDERDPAMREFLLGIAPLNHADRIKKPLFVVQGRNDPRVPWQESEQIVRTVRQNGTPVWYLLARDEGHGFAKKKNADFHFFATVAFAEEHLLK